MKLAFVFPGQGSQSVGMFNGFADNGVVRETVAQASEAVGVDFWAMAAAGPAETLNLTVNTQPLMLAAGAAFFQAYLAAGGAKPDVVAGHSLGEYTAIVAAGGLTVGQGATLVRFRAEAMQNAVPVGVGAMAAILGLDAAKVVEVCAAAAQGEVVEAVNFNDPAQTVIAGHKAAVERACEAAKAAGAKRALALPVSAPFHSSLMQPAAEQLRQRLAGESLQTLQASLINNVDVAVTHEPEVIRAALVKQAAGPVRWVESVQKMEQLGVTHVVECGPGKVLAGMIKRIAPNLHTLNIFDQASLDAALQALHA
ncbi:MAG: ACP S-malonyltransferase [Burkholderiales bacterium]|nr:ACP S-malonyltransferase [Burkholderiales bacterium]MCA3162177.1 ACP S-malonyltransferase [Burkholderiales bacterium]MCA3163239.1 ACP S-malonyltransferase [Burkholderiales bacterium]MCA3166005.1 ACP S-malonyltransferase [Burkholderiales bacterium]MCA3171091.1 ACP S-malonyltransferase [Burkholderiales bacterium]